jgi:hypothetical protein
MKRIRKDRKEAKTAKKKFRITTVRLKVEQGQDVMILEVFVFLPSVGKHLIYRVFSKSVRLKTCMSSPMLGARSSSFLAIATKV